MAQAFETSERAGGAGTPPDRNLALELVRVTEAAAMGAGRWVGRGDKNAADHAVMVVEAVKVVRDTDRVRRQGVRRAALGRIGDDARELREPLDELALLAGEVAVRVGRGLRVARVPQDPRRILDVLA